MQHITELPPMRVALATAPQADQSASHTASLSYWFFTTRHPDYNLRDELARKQVGDQDEWPVRRFADEMRPGDGVVFYQMSPRGSRTRSAQAVYAVGELVSMPQWERELDHAYPGEGKPDEQIVRVRYTRILDEPVDNDRLRSVPELRGHDWDRSRGKVNYRLTPSEWQALMNLIDGAAPEPDPRRFWWVNQGSSYRPLDGEGYLWCPQQGAAGQRVSSWVTLPEMMPGDIVLHYAGQAVYAASRVLRRAEGAVDPGLDESEDAAPGWRVDVTGREFDEPIEASEIPLAWRTRPMQNGPFDRTGRVRQGYVFPLDEHFVQRFTSRFSERLPEEIMDTAPRTIPKVAPGRRAKYWEECLAGSFICVGWEALEDLYEYRSEDEIRSALLSTGSAKNQSVATLDSRALWAYRNLKPGDLIVANRGQSHVLATGEVVAPGYEHRPE